MRSMLLVATAALGCGGGERKEAPAAAAPAPVARPVPDAAWPAPPLPAIADVVGKRREEVRALVGRPPSREIGKTHFLAAEDRWESPDVRFLIAYNEFDQVVEYRACKPDGDAPWRFTFKPIEPAGRTEIMLDTERWDLQGTGIVGGECLFGAQSQAHGTRLRMAGKLHGDEWWRLAGYVDSRDHSSPRPRR